VTPQVYIKVSNARRAVCKSLARTDKAHKLAADLREVQQEKACLAERETQLLLLAQASQKPQASAGDHDMGDLAKDTAVQQPSKRISSGNGATSMTTTAASTTSYALPTRVNSRSMKHTQVASPAKHYTTAPNRPHSPSDSTAKFFKPGEGSDQALADALTLLARLSVHKSLEEVVDDNDAQEVTDINNDEVIDGIAGDFLPGDDDSELELGHEATGSSPLALPGGTSKSIGISKKNHKKTLLASNKPTTGIPCSANPAGTPTPTSPPKRPSALRASSFTPVANTGVPTINDAVDNNSNFFKGTDQDGNGEGPRFISVLVIKDKTKIRDQLLKALADTVINGLMWLSG
jgi:hypothetical protein